MSAVEPSMQPSGSRSTPIDDPQHPRNKRKGKDKSKGGGGPKPSGGKLRGLEKDSVEVRVSKTLSWLLRHGAAKEGLPMRTDGYIKVDDLLDHPKLKAVSLNFSGIQEIVKADAKKRYNLRYEFVDASETEGDWWIKANQGHSIKTVALDLTPITNIDDIPTGIAVHGTDQNAWKSIETQGLSKMKRNHIHLAQGVSSQNVISGMRKGSQILVFIDIQKALEAGLKFYLSDNGVVLTEGDEIGFLKPEFFSRVENSKREPLRGWDGLGPIVPKPVPEEASSKPAPQGYQTPITDIPNIGSSPPV